jgi:hypothetical protein
MMPPSLARPAAVPAPWRWRKVLAAGWAFGALALIPRCWRCWKTGRVLLPDGKPAAHASVVLTHSEGDRSSIQVMLWGRGSAVRVEARNATPVRADEGGKFTLPMAAPETAVVLCHEQGLLTTRVGQIVATPDVRIHAWGVVEGKLTHQWTTPRWPADQPVAVPDPATLRLLVLGQRGHRQGGEFPPRPGAARRRPPQRLEGRGGAIATVVRDARDGESGEVTHADCIGAGTTVTGRVRLDNDRELDWQNDLGVALLKTSSRKAWPRRRAPRTTSCIAVI